MGNDKIKRIFIFDLDGTLCDTLDSLTTSVNITMDQIGFARITREQCQEYIGNGARVLIEKSIRASAEPTGQQIEEALSFYLKVFDEKCAEDVIIYPGITDFIRELKSRGAYLACLSNKPHLQAVKVVETVFGEGTFDYVQGQRADIKRKPDPDGMFKILEEFKCKKEDCIYIGDSEVDIQTGHNAGVKTIAVSWGFRSEEELKVAGAQIIVGKPEEILDMVCDDEHGK